MLLLGEAGSSNKREAGGRAVYLPGRCFPGTLASSHGKGELCPQQEELDLLAAAGTSKPRRTLTTQPSILDCSCPSNLQKLLSSRRHILCGDEISFCCGHEFTLGSPVPSLRPCKGTRSQEPSYRHGCVHPWEIISKENSTSDKGRL